MQQKQLLSHTKIGGTEGVGVGGVCGRGIGGHQFDRYDFIL